MRIKRRSSLLNNKVFLGFAVFSAVLAACTDPTLTTFTVSFNINQGSGGTPASQMVEAGRSINLPGSDGFSRTGYTFTGWNTNGNGTGVNHNAGHPFVPSGDITLFARWVPSNIFTVTFDSNSAGVPLAALTATEGSPIILPSGAGLSRPGFVFDGWNTNAAGTGITHEAGSPFTPPGNITLFARWVPLFIITFNANSGTGLPPPAQTVGQGSSIILPRGDMIFRSGYAFDGWNERSDGMGENHSESSYFTPQGNITLYARWVDGFTVSFSSNSGSGTVPAMAVSRGSAITLPNGGELSRPGYTFSGWNENAAGTGVNRNAGSRFTPGGNITLYARWISEPDHFIVTFNTNGGTGLAPSPQAMPTGGSIVLPDGAGLSRGGYTFGGWSTRADGMGDNFSAGVRFSPTGSLTLYVRWLDSVLVRNEPGAGNSLQEQLHWLRLNAQSGRRYLIEVSFDANIAPALADLPSPRNDVTVTIRGVGGLRTISLSANGRLFYVPSGITLVLCNNVILQGMSANDRPLVEVNSGAALIMNAGARITGNNNNSSYAGGAVRVNNGGKFTMYGGTISDSGTASEGGGVRLMGGGTFTMHGGTISGNTAQWGGGIFVGGGSEFIMRGGMILSNNSVADGGGVQNWGTFRISDGIIYGSGAAANVRNTAGGSGDALSHRGGMAFHGTFSAPDDFRSLGTLDSSEATIHVINGVQQP